MLKKTTMRVVATVFIYAFAITVTSATQPPAESAKQAKCFTLAGFFPGQHLDINDPETIKKYGLRVVEKQDKFGFTVVLCDHPASPIPKDSCPPNIYLAPETNRIAMFFIELDYSPTRTNWLNRTTQKFKTTPNVQIETETHDNLIRTIYRLPSPSSEIAIIEKRKYKSVQKIRVLLFHSDLYSEVMETYEAKKDKQFSLAGFHPGQYINIDDPKTIKELGLSVINRCGSDGFVEVGCRKPSGTLPQGIEQIVMLLSPKSYKIALAFVLIEDENGCADWLKKKIKEFQNIPNVQTQTTKSVDATTKTTKHTTGYFLKDSDGIAEVIKFVGKKDTAYVIQIKDRQLYDSTENDASSGGKNCQTATKDNRPSLTSFLGMKFGDVVGKYNSRFKFRHDHAYCGGLEYEFKVADPFRKFTYYAVNLTPISRKIYKVVLRGNLETYQDYENEKNALRYIILKKYNSKEIENYNWYKYQVGDKTISISRKYELYLDATDETLQELARKEKQQLDAPRKKATLDKLTDDMNKL